MKWYRNPVQMLFGNTIGLLLLLAYISFLNNASLLSHVGIFVTSFIWAGLSKKKQYIQGMFPALVCTSLLQLGYFVSGKAIYPISISIPLFSEQIKRITAIVLIMYIQGFILVPFASKVFASEKQTSDQFIQNYDPDKHYKVSS
jgi:hypothetical protein